MPLKESLSSVLVIGSGAIKIAEAAEFDYSGTQALKAIREEGLKAILVNPNVATIQTSHVFSDKVYLVPLTPEYVTRVIERERPDGIMVGFGGQTALSLGVSLWRRGILKKYGIKVLGTNIEGIEVALERGLFREHMIRNNIPVPPSKAVDNPEDAIGAAGEIGYPVMVRVSFNLGGGGSFVAWSEDEMRRRIYRAFAQAGLVKTVLVEKYLHHWKEVEYEVMRDYRGNAVVVACMENMDPMGVHTGESVVVAPCQTLTNREYYMGREVSIRVEEAIGLVGEGNVQVAFDPKSEAHYVIETNPRMSRSSALASKATGYPLAYIAAKIALGYTLDELLNKVTMRTCACFEPSLDYIVVKIPRWDLRKFYGVDESIGTEMMSVGEVMAIGRNLAEAMQKAIRMLDIGEPGLVGGDHEETLEEVMDALRRRKPYWPLWAARAIALGISEEEISRITGIDVFFIRTIGDVVRLYERLRRASNEELPALLQEAKIMGFSDEQIARALGISLEEARRLRLMWVGEPVVKQVDTLAAEWPAVTNYLYLTYGGSEDDVGEGNSVLILGAGGFRIGVSVEFDWSTVNYSLHARRLGYRSSIVNYNPETVSTDWDMSDRLYFEEVSLERVLDIYSKEKPLGVVAFVGGQVANSIAKALEEHGVRLIGTSGASVDIAEDRAKFSRLLDRLGILQPEWIEASSLEDVLRFAERVGYPVIVRPSYVLSGSAMSVAYSEDELVRYLREAARISRRYPVVVSKFIDNALEVEIDAASDGRSVVGVTMEHVERAGVHSGDATVTIPTRRLSQTVLGKLRDIALTLARELGIRGLFNIQFLVKGNEVYVIELNLRASRSMPFASKAKGINLVEYAVKATLSDGLGIGEEYWEPPSRVWAVKSPQFSWARLRGAYPHLGPEMRSTGEVASLGLVYEDALLKSWLSATPNRLPSQGILIYTYLGRDKGPLSDTARILGKWFKVFTLRSAEVEDAHEVIDEETAVSMIMRGQVDLGIVSGFTPQFDYSLRRLMVDMNIPVILHPDTALELAKAIDYYMAGGELSLVELGELTAPHL